jgi:hypothetical protein
MFGIFFLMNSTEIRLKNSCYNHMIFYLIHYLLFRFTFFFYIIIIMSFERQRNSDMSSIDNLDLLLGDDETGSMTSLDVATVFDNSDDSFDLQPILYVPPQSPRELSSSHHIVITTGMPTDPMTTLRSHSFQQNHRIYNSFLAQDRDPVVIRYLDINEKIESKNVVLNCTSLFETTFESDRMQKESLQPPCTITKPIPEKTQVEDSTILPHCVAGMATRAITTTTTITTPHPNDVLLGRGGRNCHWHGNKILRQMAVASYSTYQDSTKESKTSISMSLVLKIRALQPRGR